MKVMKNSLMVLCVVIIVAVSTPNAGALPYSSYVDPSGKSWVGHKTDTVNGFDVKVEWSVYDITSHPEEFSWAGVSLAGDNYAYVYKVTNLGGDDIGSFCMLDNAGDTELTDWSSRINGTQAAGTGITPDTPSVKQGEWVWSSGDFSAAGAVSSYLIFGSVYAPKIGAYLVEAPSGEPPTPDVPEPCTLALFGIASTLFAAKRGRKRQAV
jgi:hypothetical protein